MMQEVGFRPDVDLLQGLHPDLAAVEQPLHFVGQVQQAHQAAVPAPVAQDPPEHDEGQDQAGQSE